MDAKAIIEAAGGIYIGVMQNLQGQYLHHFNDPETGSTLAVYDRILDEGGADAVRAKMLVSREKFQKSA